jgi:Domain of unknown function (DUF4160)
MASLRASPQPSIRLPDRRYSRCTACRRSARLWHLDPPHFHALYAEHEALIDIRTLEVKEGSLPRRALALVLEWTAEHRAELMEDWDLCSRTQTPKKIAPLS